VNDSPLRSVNMTVITKPLSQQEKEKKNDASGKKLGREDSKEEVLLKCKTNTDVESATVITPSKRHTNSSHMCFVVTIMLATCLGLTILGYYQLNRRHHQSLLRRGTCRLPCHLRRQQEEQQICRRRARFNQGHPPPKDILIGQPPQNGAALVFGDLGYWPGDGEEMPLLRTDIDLKVESEFETDTIEDGKFEMSFEMDMEEETFELIQMPEVSDGVYVHDFTVNKTAIIEGSRCFAMEMDRQEIAPPRSLFELLTKTTNDGYEMDLEEIQHDMMIVLPTLSKDDVFKKYGWFIGRACRGKVVYKLEPVPEEIAMIQDNLEEKLDDPIENEIEETIEDVEVLIEEDENLRPKRSSEMQEKTFQEVSKVLVTYNIVNYDATKQ